MVTRRRYLVIAVDDPVADSLYGQTIRLDSRHTIIGQREYMESAYSLAERTVDDEDSIFAGAIVMDQTDNMAVGIVNRDNA